jgi:CspA family cold shock protein
VTSFDEAAGLGTVTAYDGVEYPFHCIEIADGSRTVAAGTVVVFDLLPKLGRWEAAALTRG